MGRFSPSAFCAFLLLAAGCYCLAAPSHARKRTPPQKQSSARSKAAVARPVPDPVARLMSALSLEQRAAQLLVIPFDGGALKPGSREYVRLQSLVKRLGPGGLILLNRMRYGAVERVDPYALAIFLNRMQRASRLPLLVAGDFERGPSMRVAETTAFPHAMAFTAAGNVEWTRQAGEFAAAESRALGVHWMLAPVADVNNNPGNPVINIRSFGENPETVSRYVQAYITGMHSDSRNRVLSVVKHFPGHGDTETDSHHALPVIEKDLAALESLELIPFRAAISAGVDAVMSAHIGVGGMGSLDLPATLNPKVMGELLREALDFRGIAITDALDMKGVGLPEGPGEVAVRALEAGADVLLMPPHPEKALAAVVAAVRSKRISRQRLDRSVRRVLEAKLRMGLYQGRLVDVERLADVLNAPESEALAERVTQAALTLLRNEPRDGRGALPVKEKAGGCLLVLTEARNSDRGLILLEEVRARRPDWPVRILDPLAPAAVLDATIQELSQCREVVLGVFASQPRYRSGGVLPGEFPALVERLVKAPPPVILVSFGNPYLIRTFPAVSAFLCAFTNVPAAETAVARALFGEIPITGKTPVSIPDFALAGDGIALVARPESNMINP